MKNFIATLTLLSCFGLFHSHRAAAGQPTVTTLAPTSVTATNARLNGSVNPNGAATAAYFQYGLTTNYGNVSPATVLAGSNGVFAMPGAVVNSIREAAGPNVAASTAPLGHWNSVASSADGLKVAATD